MDRPVAQRPGEEPAGVALAPQPGNHGVFFQEAVVRSSRAPSEQLCLPRRPPPVPSHNPAVIAMHQCP